jgi:PAS domain S-box-containing protein
MDQTFPFSSIGPDRAAEPEGSHAAGFLSWSTNAAGERCRFSRAWRKFTGRAAETGFDWQARVHPEDRDGLDRAFQQALSALQPHEFEYRLQCSDGQYRWIFEQAEPAYAEDGAFLGYTGICVDFTRRKLAEHSLRESEQRFRRSFDNPLGGMIIAGPDKVLHEVNDKLCEMLGYAREELVGKTWSMITHPDDVTPNVDVLAEVVAGRSEGYLLEKRYRRKDGRTVHAVISARAVRDDKGQVQHLVTMVQDVTASRDLERAMQAIVESTSAVIGESFFRTLVENLAEALNVRFALVGQMTEPGPSTIATVAVWNRGGIVPNFSYTSAGKLCEPVANAAGCAMEQPDVHGFLPETLLGKTPKDNSACRLLFDSAGNPLGLIAVVADKPLEHPEKVAQILRVFATRAGAELERVRADRELKRSRALLHSVVEHVPLTLFLKDARDLRYVLFNRAGERLLGCPREDVLGRRDHELFTQAEAERFVLEDLEILGSGKTLDVPEQSLSRALGLGVVRKQKIALYDESGKPEYVLGIVEDITERKQVEHQLRAAKAEAERANNAKSRFLAAASHDLRQPLSALSLYVGVLRNKVAPADRPLLNNMKDCVGSLSELLTDLLDLSKLDAGVVTPNVTDFPIAEVLANLVSVHAPEALLKGLRLRCVPSGLIARTDAVLFRRMLGNLISNAISYTERGSVLIGCRRRQGRTWVEVWDTGIGVPENKTAEIFEEFRQLGSDARGGSKGSGLGLAIVAKTATLLGLEIRVRSWPERGSMFSVEVPVGTLGLKLHDPVVKHRSLRVALVEDNAAVRQALTGALSGLGHVVVAAATARELYFKLEHCLPDIIISDYRLAGAETGFDVISLMRDKFGASLPAIIVTGDTDPKLMRTMASKGIAVQHKPLRIESLQACITGQFKTGIAEA